KTFVARRPRAVGETASQSCRNVVHVWELIGAEYLRMAGQDLLAQGRAGARHADDEYRECTGVAAARRAREIVGVERGQDSIGAAHLCAWIVRTALRFQLGATKRVALVHVIEGSAIVALGLAALSECKVDLPALLVGHRRIPGVLGNARDLLLRNAGLQ